MTAGDVAAPAVPFSPVRVGVGTIHVSGQVGSDPATGEVPADFEGQMRLALANLERALESAGGARSTVLKTTVFLTRAEDFAAMNRIYAEVFAPPHPARSTIVCQLVRPELHFEIDAVAARRSQP